jgi:hypothetical protein
VYLERWVLFMLWVCSPAQIVVLVAQVAFFKRRGVFRSGHGGRALVGLVITYLLTLAVTIPLWLIIPWRLLPPWIVLFPNKLISWLPPFFLPSVLASIIVAPVVASWVAQLQRRS